MPKRTFTGRLEALATLLEPTRQRLYRYVTAELTAVTRDQAAEAVGISRAMAAFHLDKLVEAGLLRAGYRRLSSRTGRGAGRPSKLYRRSRRRFDVTVPARQHGLLAHLLIRSRGSSVPSSSGEEVAHAYGRSLGVRARKRLPGWAGPNHLTKCVADVMTDLGFEPISVRPTELLARNCPFDPLSRQFETVVCGTALGIVHGILDGVGAKQIEASRDYRPDRCCIVLNTAPKPIEDTVSPSL